MTRDVPKDGARYTWTGREVVVEIGERPHLLSRIEVAGGHFPRAGREPFMRIVVDEKTTVPARFAEPSEDGRSLRGYFASDLPERGVVEFGYGADVLGRLELGEVGRGVEKLDRTRLPRDVAIPDWERRKPSGGVRPG